MADCPKWLRFEAVASDGRRFDAQVLHYAEEGRDVVVVLHVRYVLGEPQVRFPAIATDD